MRGRLIRLVAVVACSAAGGLAVVPSAFAASASLTRSGDTGLTLHFDAGGATFGLKFTVASGLITGVQSSPNNGCGVSSDATRILCTWTNSTKPTTGDIAFTTNECYPANGGGTMEVDSGSATATGPSDACGGGTPPPPPPPPPGGSGTPATDCDALLEAQNAARAEWQRLANQNAYAMQYGRIAGESDSTTLLVGGDGSSYVYDPAPALDAKRTADRLFDEWVACEEAAHSSRRALRRSGHPGVARAAAAGPSYSSVGLVALRTAGKKGAGTCKQKSSSKRARCKQLIAALRSDVSAQALATPAWGEAAIALTRRKAAQAAGNSAGAALQSAAFRVALGEIVAATAKHHAADVRLAKSYRRNGIRIEVSLERSARALEEFRNLSGPFAEAFRRTSSHGFTLAELRASVQRDLAGIEPAAFDVLAALESKPPSQAVFTAEYRSISLAEVGAIVTALKKQKAISNSLAKQLNKDLKAAGKGKTARKKNMRKFRDHAKKAKATPENFLRTAAAAFL